VNAPTLGWSDARVGAVLRVALGVPVLVENDVNTLAVAERLYGAGREYGSYLVVTIGRGIGCGIVIDGNIYRGANGGAGEIGRDVLGDAGKAQNIDVQHLTGPPRRFEIRSAVVSQTEL